MVMNHRSIREMTLNLDPNYHKWWMKEMKNMIIYILMVLIMIYLEMVYNNLVLDIHYSPNDRRLSEHSFDEHMKVWDILIESVS